jgi:hypothetical protein
MEMGMEHQGLTPGVQGGEDARLRPEILGVGQQGAQGIADRLKQQRRHHRDIGQPQRIQLMREGKDHMVMVTRQQPRLLEGQPTFGLEIRALGTRPVPTRVVPDTGDVAVRTRLDMATQRRGPALHDSARGGADVGRQGMALLIGGKGVLEDLSLSRFLSGMMRL